MTLGSEPDQKTLPILMRRRLISLPLLVGDEEEKGLVATVSLTCAGTK